MMKALRTFLLLAAAVALTCSCEWFGCGTTKKYEKVLIMYGAGFNDLSSDIYRDITELKNNELPTLKSDFAVVIVNHSVGQGGFRNPTQPVIMRLYKDKKAGAVLDTLSTLESSDLLTKKEVMRSALNYIAGEFKSDSYGIVFSSHGTGWLPPGYYESPSKFDKLASTAASIQKSGRRNVYPDALPSVDRNLPGPRVRAFGDEFYYNAGGTRMSQYLDIIDFADAIPFRAEFIIMDACLMGCVEVAYQFKDKCHYLGFSPAEILSDGLVYNEATTLLLKSGDPDLEGFVDVCSDYYSNNGYESFTFSLIDCSKLDALASACRQAFSECRDGIAEVSHDKIQRYYRYDYHWFYDLRDILAKSGVGASALSAVDAALGSCVIKEVHTASFLLEYGGFRLNSCCGLSMYLPNKGSAYLDGYYKTLAWNIATSLVQ